MHHTDILRCLMMLRSVYTNKRQEQPKPEEEKLPLDVQDVKIKNFGEFTAVSAHKHTCKHTCLQARTTLLLL